MLSIIKSPRKNLSCLTIVCFCLITVGFISCGKNNNSSTLGTDGNNTNSGNNISYTGSFVSSGVDDSSKATGTVSASFNTTTLQLDYTIAWKSLTSDPVQMHFHDAGPVIVKLTGYPVSQSGVFSGTCYLTSAQGGDLAAGYIYAMIHTKNYTAGEIMAPLVKQ
jgi:hypothetical protein